MPRIRERHHYVRLSAVTYPLFIRLLNREESGPLDPEKIGDFIVGEGGGNHVGIRRSLFMSGSMLVVESRETLPQGGRGGRNRERE